MGERKKVSLWCDDGERKKRRRRGRALVSDIYNRGWVTELCYFYKGGRKWTLEDGQKPARTGREREREKEEEYIVPWDHWWRQARIDAIKFYTGYLYTWTFLFLFFNLIKSSCWGKVYTNSIFIQFHIALSAILPRPAGYCIRVRLRSISRAITYLNKENIYIEKERGKKAFEACIRIYGKMSHMRMLVLSAS